MYIKNNNNRFNNRFNNKSNNRFNNRFNNKSNNRFNNRFNNKSNNRFNNRFNNKSNNRFNNKSNNRFNNRFIIAKKLEQLNRYIKKISLPPITNDFKIEKYIKQRDFILKLKKKNPNLYKNYKQKLFLKISNNLKTSKKFSHLYNVLNFKDRKNDKIEFPEVLYKKNNINKVYRLAKSRMIKQKYFNSLSYHMLPKEEVDDKLMKKILKKKFGKSAKMIGSLRKEKEPVKSIDTLLFEFNESEELDITRVVRYFNLFKITPKKFIDLGVINSKIIKKKKNRDIFLSNKYLFKSLMNYNFNFEANKVLDNKVLDNNSFTENKKVLYRFFKHKNKYRRKKHAYHIMHSDNFRKYKAHDILDYAFSFFSNLKNFNTIFFNNNYYRYKLLYNNYIIYYFNFYYNIVCNIFNQYIYIIQLKNEYNYYILNGFGLNNNDILNNNFLLNNDNTNFNNQRSANPKNFKKLLKKYISELNVINNMFAINKLWYNNNIYRLVTTVLKKATILNLKTNLTYNSQDLKVMKKKGNTFVYNITNNTENLYGDLHGVKEKFKVRKYWKFLVTSFQNIFNLKNRITNKIPIFNIYAVKKYLFLLDFIKQNLLKIFNYFKFFYLDKNCDLKIFLIKLRFYIFFLYYRIFTKYSFIKNKGSSSFIYNWLRNYFKKKNKKDNPDTGLNIAIKSSFDFVSTFLEKFKKNKMKLSPNFEQLEKQFIKLKSNKEFLVKRDDLKYSQFYIPFEYNPALDKNYHKKLAKQKRYEKRFKWMYSKRNNFWTLYKKMYHIKHHFRRNKRILSHYTPIVFLKSFIYFSNRFLSYKVLYQKWYKKLNFLIKFKQKYKKKLSDFKKVKIKFFNTKFDFNKYKILFNVCDVVKLSKYIFKRVIIEKKNLFKKELFNNFGYSKLSLKKYLNKLVIKVEKKLKFIKKKCSVILSIKKFLQNFFISKVYITKKQNFFKVWKHLKKFLKKYYKYCKLIKGGNNIYLIIYTLKLKNLNSYTSNIINKMYKLFSLYSNYLKKKNMWRLYTKKKSKKIFQNAKYRKKKF